MCMTRPDPVRQRGFTLIELIIFIVVISAGLAGILSVMNTVVKSSADPMVRKQAMALAESVLEEVMLHNFNDPDGTTTGETGRSNWDNVDDFDAINEVVSASGPVFTGLPVGVYGYTIKVDVDPATLGALAAKTVTVTVSRGAESISLIGYRACYGEAACPL
jgi:MSHA pilin protein MshD